MNKLRRSLVLRFLIVAVIVITVSFLAQFLLARGSIWKSVEQYYEDTGTVAVKYAAAFMYDIDCSDPDDDTLQSLESMIRLCRDTDIDSVVYEPLSADGERFYAGIYIDDSAVMQVFMPAADNDALWFRMDENEKSLSKDGKVIFGRYDISEKDRSVRVAAYAGAGADSPGLVSNSYLVFAHAVMDHENRMTAIVRVWVSADHLIAARNTELFRTFGIGMAVSLVLLILLTVYIWRRMLVPIRKLSGKMTGFVSGNGLEHEKLPVHGHDEIARMAESYNTMTGDIDRYVSQIDSMTRAREELNAELRIAAQIQKGLLPDSGYSSDRVSVSALMKPAKLVGGDFYDFFPLENGKVCAVIADVSGKGVSAAMFMSSAVMMIRYTAGTGLTPAQILGKVNTDLCSSNPELRFITAFLAIYDPADGTLTYANAGHNLPYIASSGPEQLAGGNGMMLGVFHGETWEDTAVKVTRDSCLFMYTDGVTEAVNDRREFFGEERLKEVLKKACGGDGPCTEEEIIQSVDAEVTEFADGAEQNDDITMVCMRFKP